jgi:hypothetical protein
MFLTGLMIHRGFTIPHDEKFVAWFLVFLVVPTLPAIDLPETTQQTKAGKPSPG